MSSEPKKTRLPDEIRCQEDFNDLVDFMMSAAQGLTDLAGSYGLTLTITTSPKQPLAMGNYDMECEIRPSHAAYRSQS